MYGLCTDTVTVFRAGEEIVLTGCYLEETQGRQRDIHGTWEQGAFLLIVPGDRPIYPGDQISRDGRKMTIHRVIPYFLDGKVSHREGRGS